MKQSIEISRSDVMTEVRKTLEYMGTHHVTEGGNLYDILAATPEQVEQLDRFFVEGCADIAVHTKKYVSEWSASETFAISYELNEGYKIQMLDVVKQDMFSYLVNSIISKWLMLCNLASERIQLYQNMATLYLQSIKRSILTNESNSKTYAEQAVNDTIGGTSAMVIDNYSEAEEGESDGTIGGTSAMVIDNYSEAEEGEEEAVIGQELPQDLQENEHKIYKF